jgi:hypothetical protein
MMQWFRRVITLHTHTLLMLQNWSGGGCREFILVQGTFLLNAGLDGQRHYFFSILLVYRCNVYNELGLQRICRHPFL